MSLDVHLNRSFARRSAGLLVGLALACVVALGLGAVPIAPMKLLGLVGLGDGAVLAEYERTVLWQIRLPRITLALIIGAGLAVSGAAMQGLLRNPLAEPGLVGVSSGAALAAAAYMVAGAGLVPIALGLPLASFAGAALAAWAVLRLAAVGGRTQVAMMLLAGLALNAIAGAGIGLLSYLADDFALRAVTLWMFGSLARAGGAELAIGAPLLLAATSWITLRARALNALLLGEAEARHLGVDVESLKRQLTLAIVLAAGTAVALAGIIGFVGLIVPHLVRLWVGPDHRRLLPLCALLGALLLLVADTLARTLFVPAELPIGILTALVGGPFFLALLLRYRGGAELS
ncbi:FecCD family ABC transporter permease [Sinimarinibacterium thermocellulolyticum]|uniref:Iron ABC transporter permease n=1 Tax=Sinimarinibacterium thermocellulolyticum TaxID=3170016 RepID=A0ABV2AAY4_9GAMM